METVFTTTDPKEAAMVEVILRDAGVEFRMDNENSAFLAVGMPSPAAGIEFHVRPDALDAARRAIESGLRLMDRAPRRGEPRE